jgi:cell division protein FtsB
MQNNLFAWIFLTLIGISLSLFTMYYSLTKVETYFSQTLSLGKAEIMESSKINGLKSKNSELKTKIQSLSREVSELGDQVNQYLLEYRTSKQFLDSLITGSEQNAEVFDSIINYYNDEVLKNTTLIDSVNKQYEIKSTTLLQFISDLEGNSTEIELVLLEKNVKNKMFSLKIGAIIYHIFIFGITLILGIWLTVFGLKRIREN